MRIALTQHAQGRLCRTLRFLQAWIVTFTIHTKYEQTLFREGRRLFLGVSSFIDRELCLQSNVPAQLLLIFCFCELCVHLDR